jgi:hypothetical protein
MITNHKFMAAETALLSYACFTVFVVFRFGFVGKSEPVFSPLRASARCEAQSLI